MRGTSFHFDTSRVLYVSELGDILPTTPCSRVCRDC